MREWEYPQLKDFLYETVFQPGVAVLPRSAVKKPELAIALYKE